MVNIQVMTVSPGNKVAVSRHNRIEMILAQQHCYMQKLKLMKQHSEILNSTNLQANDCSKRSKHGPYYSFRLLPFICYNHQPPQQKVFAFLYVISKKSK